LTNAESQQRPGSVQAASRQRPGSVQAASTEADNQSQGSIQREIAGGQKMKIDKEIAALGQFYYFNSIRVQDQNTD